MERREKKFRIDFGTLGLSMAVVFSAGILTGMTLIVVVMKMFVV